MVIKIKLSTFYSQSQICQVMYRFDLNYFSVHFICRKIYVHRTAYMYISPVFPQEA